MTSYQCPICGVNDLYAYTCCNHPACFDGRDIEVRAIAAKRDHSNLFAIPAKAEAEVGVREALEKIANGPLQTATAYRAIADAALANLPTK